MSHYTPKMLSESLGHQSLLRQCILTHEKRNIPEGWHQTSFDDYWIGAQQELPITPIQFTPIQFTPIQFTPIQFSDHRFTGFMLGYVIDPFNYQYNTPYIGDVITKQIDFSAVESYLHRLSGRFICVVSDGASSRIYLDASGSFSMMYSAELGIVASSSMLIPYEDGVDDDMNLIELLSVDTKNGIYPFGLTSRKKVKRLLPNHYLDLDTWSAARHWPTSSFNAVSPINYESKYKAREIASIMEKTIDTIMMQGFSPYMSLTAGVDSRTMLACAKKWKNINYFTWDLPDDMARIDIETARQIAVEHQLNYVSYPFGEANDYDRQEWLYRTSLCVGEKRGLSLTTTINAMDSGQPYFAGNVSEVSRGVYWRENDTSLTELTAEEIVNRIGVPADPSIIESAKTWLEGLPEITIQETLDLVYLEQRVGCWASEIGHGHAGGPFHIYPFSNRIIFELMLSSSNDYSYRKSKGIIKEIIAQQSPELMKFLFNGTHLSRG